MSESRYLSVDGLTLSNKEGPVYTRECLKEAFRAINDVKKRGKTYITDIDGQKVEIPQIDESIPRSLYNCIVKYNPRCEHDVKHPNEGLNSVWYARCPFYLDTSCQYSSGISDFSMAHMIWEIRTWNRIWEKSPFVEELVNKVKEMAIHGREIKRIVAFGLGPMSNCGRNKELEPGRYLRHKAVALIAYTLTSMKNGARTIPHSVPIPLFCEDEYPSCDLEIMMNHLDYSSIHAATPGKGLLLIDEHTLIISEREPSFNNVVIDLTHDKGPAAMITCKGHEVPVRGLDLKNNVRPGGIYAIKNPESPRIDCTVSRTLQYHDPKHCKTVTLDNNFVFGHPETKKEISIYNQGILNEEESNVWNEVYKIVLQYRTDRM